MDSTALLQQIQLLMNIQRQELAALHQKQLQQLDTLHHTHINRLARQLNDLVHQTRVSQTTQPQPTHGFPPMTNPGIQQHRQRPRTSSTVGNTEVQTGPEVSPMRHNTSTNASRNAPSPPDRVFAPLPQRKPVIRCFGAANQRQQNQMNYQAPGPLSLHQETASNQPGYQPHPPITPKSRAEHKRKPAARRKGPVEVIDLCNTSDSESEDDVIVSNKIRYNPVRPTPNEIIPDNARTALNEDEPGDVEPTTDATANDELQTLQRLDTSTIKPVAQEALEQKWTTNKRRIEAMKNQLKQASRLQGSREGSSAEGESLV